MGRELPITGFGIADFRLRGAQHPARQEGPDLSTRCASRTQKATVLAFEMKLRDWRKALTQALRYRYFANAALVVLPPLFCEIVRRRLSSVSYSRRNSSRVSPPAS